MKFVICISDMYYRFPNKELCLVVDEDEYEYNVVCVSGSNTYDDFVYEIPKIYFNEITIEEYVKSFPDIYIDFDKINRYEKNEKKENDLWMKYEDDYIPAEKEYEDLTKECMDILGEYDYTPTTVGVRRFLEEYFNNKGKLISVFKKHPNYNGKYQIAFDKNYETTIDKSVIFEFSDWILNSLHRLLEPYTVNGYTYGDIFLSGKRSKEFKSLDIETQTLTSLKYNCENLNLWYHNGCHYVIGDSEKCLRAKEFRSIVYEVRNTLLTDDDANFINKSFPEVKAVKGQKLSRVVNKIAKILDYDKLSDYNKEFAKYADAINPLKIVRHTVLSLHPVDYLTMSFGNSWSSCHTMDKRNKRGMPNSYEGMYSAGTMSYMLDETSFVFYTVDANYNGDYLELEPKISRCMFHVGFDKLVQARMYPQSSDGDTGLYTDVREIAQSVIAECFAFPNFWSIEKGTEACNKVTKSIGGHYRDYLNFEYCNVSYPKKPFDYKNRKKFTIGHNAICPHCGNVHESSDNIECRECREDGEYCYHCGEWGPIDSMIETDGRYYCYECTSYCSYHDRREAIFQDEMYFVNGFGYVCEEAIESGEFEQCDDCGCYCAIDEMIYTDDGNYYCNEYCAMASGYRRVRNGKWIHVDELILCPNCNELCLQEEIVEGEPECCKYCKDKI